MADLNIDKIKEYTGIDASTDEEFIEQFGKKFYTKDQIFKDEETKNEFFGRAFGSATTATKKIFESMGVEITGDDLKNPIEKVVQIGLQRVNERFDAEKQELQKTAGLTADEKIKEATETIEKLKLKNKDYENLLSESNSKLTEIENNYKSARKNDKLQFISSNINNSIKWNPDKDEYSKRGFITMMNEKYKIDLDENDEPYIVEAQSGSRIKSEGTHSEFLTPQQVYEMEALKSGMAAVNKNAGKQVNERKSQPSQPAHQPSNPPANQPVRKMANTTWQPGS